MRLNKFLAHAGIASRRKADELIVAGGVQVNGKIVRTVGVGIHPKHDIVVVDGKTVSVEQPVTLVFYKPKGVVCTLHDEQERPSLSGLIPSSVRLYPAGRLDQESEGLLILTNQGELALHITHPRHGFEKTYRVWINPPSHYRIPVIMAALKKTFRVLGHAVKFAAVSYLGRDKDGLCF